MPVHPLVGMKPEKVSINFTRIEENNLVGAPRSLHQKKLQFISSLRQMLPITDSLSRDFFFLFPLRDFVPIRGLTFQIPMPFCGEW
jgi:hypothetical protein